MYLWTLIYWKVWVHTNIISVQHHKIHSSFLPLHICNFLFLAMSSLVFIVLNTFTYFVSPLYMTNISSGHHTLYPHGYSPYLTMTLVPYDTLPLPHGCPPHPAWVLTTHARWSFNVNTFFTLSCDKDDCHLSLCCCSHPAWVLTSYIRPLHGSSLYLVQVLWFLTPGHLLTWTLFPNCFGSWHPTSGSCSLWISYSPSLGSDFQLWATPLCGHPWYSSWVLIPCLRLPLTVWTSSSCWLNSISPYWVLSYVDNILNPLWTTVATS